MKICKECGNKIRQGTIMAKINGVSALVCSNICLNRFAIKTAKKGKNVR